MKLDRAHTKKRRQRGGKKETSMKEIRKKKFDVLKFQGGVDRYGSRMHYSSHKGTLRFNFTEFNLFKMFFLIPLISIEISATGMSA